MSFRKQDVLALSVIGLFCLYLFRDIVFSGHLLIGDDFVTFYLGMKKFLYDEVRIHHEIPYWNPYIFGGIPFWAHLESTIFYPLGFLFYIVSPEKAYGYTMFLHFVLAGLFMYLLARSLGVTELGGFVASTVFVCNGFVMAILFLGHMSPVESYVWLPLVITFLNRAVQSPKPWGSATIAGGLWGIQILAGAPQDAFYTFLASTLFLICMARGGQAMKTTATKLLAIAAMMFLIGAGLSCIQIIPAFELISESVRTSLDTYEMATLASYPLQGIITILMPHFFGNYADSSVWVSKTPWSIPQQNLYTGILPLVLMGFVSLKGKVEKKVMVFGILLAILSLLLAFGHHTPLYKVVYLLPGFDRFRAPSKIMVLWGFSIALLAGIGMDGLLKYIIEKRTRRLYLFLFLVISLIVLDLVFCADRSLILRFFSPFVLSSATPGKMAEATGIVASEFHRLTLISSFIFLLILLMRRNLLTISLGAAALCALMLVNLGFVHGKAVRHDDSTYERILEIRRDLNASLAWDKSLYRVGAFQHSLGANLEMFFGYQTVGGFTALFPSRYYDYVDKYAEYKLPRAWTSFFYGLSRDHVLMDLLNVKYEILYASKAIGFRTTYLPRAFLVPHGRFIEKEEILDILTSSDFDPHKTVLLEKDGGAEHPEAVSRESSSSGEAEIKSYRPDSILLTTDAPVPAYLFLSEIFYPGWKAFIDGQPTRILRGNYLFRVLEVPEGRHQVRLEFDPWTIKAGTGTTLLTTLLILAIPVFRRLKRKAPRP